MIIPEKWYKTLNLNDEINSSNNIQQILELLNHEEDNWFKNFYVSSVSEIKRIMPTIIQMVSKKIN